MEYPEKKEIYSRVTKSRFIDLLVRMREIIKIAKERNVQITCYGD